MDTTVVGSGGEDAAVRDAASAWDRSEADEFQLGRHYRRCRCFNTRGRSQFDDRAISKNRLSARCQHIGTGPRLLSHLIIMAASRQKAQLTARTSNRRSNRQRPSSLANARQSWLSAIRPCI